MRLLLLAVALLLAGCADAAPAVFYGYVESADAEQVCLSDARVEDPDAQRCFRIEPDTITAEDFTVGDIVAVEYERDAEPPERAIEIRLDEPAAD